MWFTEDPWPPVLILIVLAVVMGIAWNATRRGKYILFGFGAVVMGLGVLVVEDMIITPGEELEAQVLALADAVKRGDTPTVLEFFKSEALKSTVGSQLENITIEGDLPITDLEVQVDDKAITAVSHFRANTSARWKKAPPVSGPSRWNLYWERTATQPWKIHKIERLDPIKGNVINTWSF